MDYQYVILNNDNDDEITEYENEMYNAYHGKPNALLKFYYLNSQKMILKGISVYDTISFLVKAGNQIAAGMTVHINPKNEFLLEKMGFNIQKTNTMCENLTLFVKKDFSKDTFKILINLMNFAAQSLFEKGITEIVSSTPEKYKSMQLFYFDAELGETKNVSGEKRVLMRQYIKYDNLVHEKEMQI